MNKPTCCDGYSVGKSCEAQLSTIVAIFCLRKDDVGFAKEEGGIKKPLEYPFLSDINLHPTVFLVQICTLALVLSVEDFTAIVECDDSLVLGDFIG